MNVKILFAVLLAATLTTQFCFPAAVAQGLQVTQLAPKRNVTKSFTEPIEQSNVASVEVGVLKKIHVKEGDEVVEGEALAIIRHDVLLHDEKIAVEKSESTAELTMAQTKMKLLEDQKLTLEKLYGEGHVNKYEVEQKLTEYENAVAQYHVALNRQQLGKLEVGRIRSRIEQRTIRSPISGFVAEIHKQVGEHISNQEPQFATVVRVDQLRARFYLDEETLDSIVVGQEVSLEIGTPRRASVARIIFVSPMIDPDSGTGRVDVMIDNPDSKFRSGTVCFWGELQPQTNTASILTGFSLRK